MTTSTSFKTCFVLERIRQYTISLHGSRIPPKKKVGGGGGNAKKSLWHAAPLQVFICSCVWTDFQNKCVWSRILLEKIPNLAFQRTKIMYSFINIFCLQTHFFLGGISAEVCLESHPLSYYNTIEVKCCHQIVLGLLTL